MDEADQWQHTGSPLFFGLDVLSSLKNFFPLLLFNDLNEQRPNRQMAANQIRPFEKTTTR